MKNKSKNTNKRVVVTRSKVKKPKKKKTTQYLSSFGVDQRRYLQFLASPFSATPYRLGAGIMGPSNLASGYARQQNTYGALTHVAHIVRFMPQNGTIVVGKGDFIRTYSSNNMSTILSASAISASDAFNKAQLSTQLNEFRINSAGIKLSYGYPTTATPPILWVGVVRDSLTSLEAKSFDTLINSNALHMRPLFTPGSASVNLPYIPMSLEDFQTDAFGMTIDSSSYVGATLVIVAVGVPPSTTYYMETIAHYESPLSINQVVTSPGTSANSSISSLQQAAAGAIQHVVSQLTAPVSAASGALVPFTPPTSSWDGARGRPVRLPAMGGDGGFRFGL